MADKRRQLAEELVAIHRKHKKDFDRIEEIKVELRQIASVAGENFKLDFVGKGSVSVSRPKDKEFKGTLPVLDEATFLALPDAQRDKLVAKNVVAMKDVWSEPYHGRVTVKIF